MSSAYIRFYKCDIRITLFGMTFATSFVKIHPTVRRTGNTDRYGQSTDVFPLRRLKMNHVQKGSGAHPASYPMDTGGSFPGRKAVRREADHSPPSSAEIKECVELCLHFPSKSSWRAV
jgi:hypothetical protein